ncbi:MAG: protoporphyrinogen/coproporphyrinogen oxidase [Planctomycetota bacterium]|jgi:hypothetical protein
MRVAIIGTGPSGLTLAYYLKSLGIESVQLFEARDEVGGQSLTHDIDGFPVEMGTVYLTTGYILAKKIAKEVGCPAKVLPPATVLDEKGEVFVPDRPRTSLLIRYIGSWLRWYFRGQLRAPSDPDNALSFAEWLHRRGYAELERGFAFTAGTTAQLYGPLDAITAHSGMNWVRPSLLLTGMLDRVGHIPQGFQNMWKRLAEHLGYPIRFGQRIDAVRPVGSKVELHYKGERIDEPFDHVFLACPLDHFESHPVAGVAGSPLDRIEHPLSSALRERFTPFDATEVYSAGWRATNWPAHVPSRAYLPAATTGAVGPLLTIRQYGNNEGRSVGQLCSYALPDESAVEDRLANNAQRLEKNREQVLADMREIVGLKEIEIVHERLWRYNIRYSRQQMEDRLPLFLEKSQGEQNVWYTGGALSHWNIDAITDYNHHLARRFAKRTGLPLLTRLKLLRFGQILTDF